MRGQPLPTLPHGRHCMMREEKLQEEKTSEDLIHKLILEDMEVGKRKMEDQQKKDEPLMLKTNQEIFPERLSDSENEEPFQSKHAHRSAFVSKGSTYSFAFLAGNLTSKLERSQSCNDTIQDRSKSRQRSAPANRTKGFVPGQGRRAGAGAAFGHKSPLAVSSLDGQGTEGVGAEEAAQAKGRALHRFPLLPLTQNGERQGLGADRLQACGRSMWIKSPSMPAICPAGLESDPGKCCGLDCTLLGHLFACRHRASPFPLAANRSQWELRSSMPCSLQVPQPMPKLTSCDWPLESAYKRVTSVTSTLTPIVGVLSSTQNNRCLSAPDLTAEKRLVFNSISSLSILHKPERSISPESNDSISEELNHFKPIVCSPCTPPKRLPDGKVLSPLIIKSTPRNLNRSLQKPTTYEASPRILKKWEQIFQERQIKKTFSKATLTSLASETGEDFLVPDIANSNKEQPRMLSDQIPPDTAAHPNTEFDYFPSVSEMQLERTGNKKTGSRVLTMDANSSELDTRSNGTSLNSQVSDVSDVKTNSYLDKSCLSIGTKIMTRRIIGVNPVLPGNSVLGVSVKTAGKKQLKYLNNSELLNVQNGTCSSVENVLGEQPPSLRRGRKRHCKTKHLEQNGSVKRLKQTAGEMGLATDDLLVKEMEQKLQQEEEDRRLALQLQRIFDSENRTVDRRKGRVDQYLLRSKSTTGAK